METVGWLVIVGWFQTVGWLEMGGLLEMVCWLGMGFLSFFQPIPPTPHPLQANSYPYHSLPLFP